MRARAATRDDVPAIVALQGRWETHWLGAPENDESEILEDLDRVPLETQSLLLVADDQVVGAAWFWGTHTSVMVDPSAPAAPCYADLLGWLTERVSEAHVISTDLVQQQVLRDLGWRHTHSGFELLREVDGWELAAPSFPDGVRVTDLRDLEQVHALIYRESAWLDVPSHHDRDLAGWTGLFVTETTDPAQQVIAWRGDRVVGASLGRLFSDGSGWIAQLAVARDEQKQGLGRALLLETYRRRIAAGATRLGLGVAAENEGALGLYLSIGLRIEREWQDFTLRRS